MTGVLNVSFSVSGTNVAITVGSSAGNHGYHFTDRGSASPTSVFGIVIASLGSIDSTSDLDLSLSGTTHSQSLFRYLLVQDGTGAVRKYNTADASFAVGGGVSNWRWGTGSNRVWTSGDAAEVHVVQFFR
jgi:hypothetical protein